MEKLRELKKEELKSIDGGFPIAIAIIAIIAIGIGIWVGRRSGGNGEQ